MKKFLALIAALAITMSFVCFPAATAEEEVQHYTAAVYCHTITKDLNEFAWLQEWEDEAGIDVDWQCYWSDWDETKSAMFASLDLPDFFFPGGSLSLSDVINNQELFVCLDDYIAGSTNLASIFESDEYMQQKSVLTDGHIYSISGRLPCRPYTATGFFINQTWMDKLGLEMPTTPDELLEVLLAMKNGDPNENGEADEWPWVGAGDAADFLMGCWGVAESRYDLMVEEDGSLTYVYTTEAYRKALEFLAKCYAAGVIDPEIYTQDWSVAYADAQREVQIVGLCSAWTRQAILGNTNAKDYSVMPQLRGEGYEGDLKWPGDPAGLVYNSEVCFAMTTNCAEEKRQSLFNFIDSLYTPERTLTQWGGEGVIFNDDGTVDVTVPEEMGDMSIDDYQWTYAYNDKAVGYVPAEYESNINLHPDLMDKFEIDAVYKDITPTPVMPLVILDNDASAELSYISTDMSNIKDQFKADIVTGVKTMDDDTWNAYLADMAAAQVDRYVEIYTEAIAE